MLIYIVYFWNAGRSGEWGDHVTLQAAADAVGDMLCSEYLSRFICELIF